MLNVTHLISPYESPLAAHEVEAVIFVVSYLVDLMHLVFNFIHDLIFKFLNLLVVLTSIIIQTIRFMKLLVGDQAVLGISVGVEPYQILIVIIES